MSTKTSIKRIAAVAAVALTLGGFSAVSAHAETTADTMVASATASSTTVGTAASIYVSQTFIGGANTDYLKATAYVTSAPAYSIALPTWTALTSDSATAVGFTQLSATMDASVAGTIKVTNSTNGAAYVQATNKLSFTPAVAGTYVISLYQTNATSSGAAAAKAAPITWTVTAAANAPASASFTKAWMKMGATNSTGYMAYTPSAAYAYAFEDYASQANATAMATGDAAAAADTNVVTSGSVLTSASSAGTYVASIAVLLRNNAPAYDNSAAAPITVAISGPGYVGIDSHAVLGKSVTEAVSTSGSDGYGSKSKSVYVVSDGTTGTATITISAGGITLATRTVVFYGTAASAKATNNLNVLNVNGGSGSGTGNAAAEIYLADASGNPVAGAAANIKGTSSDTTVLNSFAVGAGGCADDATSGAGYYTCDVTTTAGQTSTGKSATITFYVMSGSTVKATSNALAFTTGDIRANSVVLSTDATSYAPGDKVTVTLTAVDAAGNPVADYDTVAAQSMSIFAADSTTGNIKVSAGISTALFTTALVKFAGGKATATFYAPYTSGKLVISGTLAGTLGGAKTANLTAAIVGTTLTTTVSISSPTDAAAQAAVDAANEATDAANAATDAANNAMDSADAAQQAALDAGDKADAALAAVTDLATKVSAIATQIAALSALVKKIAAKVKA